MGGVRGLFGRGAAAEGAGGVSGWTRAGSAWGRAVGWGRATGGALRGRTALALGGARGIAGGILGGAGTGFLAGEIGGAIWSGTDVSRSMRGSAGMGVGTVLAGAALGSRYGPVGTIAGAVTAPATALYRFGMDTRRERLQGEANTRDVSAHQASLYGMSAEQWEAMTDEQRATHARTHPTGVRAAQAAAARPSASPYQGAHNWLESQRSTFDENKLKQAMKEAFDESQLAQDKGPMSVNLNVNPPEMARALEGYIALDAIRRVELAVS
jgi:hypothetical protein